ncbi:Coenzyme F420 hydrogenase/dehydrogenase, beta subunit C-terminal domain [Labrys okinawensis]|nr:Coenzyme F420 hydrogenase/dehydrogenase, beta subunit C-terminal domain [Labrys okinawensis]
MKVERSEWIVSPAEIVSAGLCIGCGSCVAQEGGRAAEMTWDKYGQLKPSGGDWLTTRSPTFSRTCPFAPASMNEDELATIQFPSASHIDGHIGRFEAAYVGHAEEQGFRAEGSSGGMVSWVAAELLKRGLVDGIVHVAPSEDPHTDGRHFRYRVSRTLKEVRGGAKSRYYPVELSAALSIIRAEPGKYAVIGIPCFIKAVNLLRIEDPLLRERIAFTLGLVCGHMKSSRFVESLAWQMQVDLQAVTAIDYRIKDTDRPANWYTAQFLLGSGERRRKDWWHLVDGDWGSGFFQNSACDFCDDVVAETADISFGDAWVEPYSSDGRGTNIVVVRSACLHRLLEEANGEGRLRLRAVDAGFVHDTQAAGFRQRREGLAFRLDRRGDRLPLRKRVDPCRHGLGTRRKLIYLLRRAISRWSHRMFRLARMTGCPPIYLFWAKTVLGLYRALAYSRGRVGGLCDRLLGDLPPSGSKS